MIKEDLEFGDRLEILRSSRGPLQSNQLRERHDINVGIEDANARRVRGSRS